MPESRVYIIYCSRREPKNNHQKNRKQTYNERNKDENVCQGENLELFKRPTKNCYIDPSCKKCRSKNYGLRKEDNKNPSKNAD